MESWFIPMGSSGIKMYFVNYFILWIAILVSISRRKKFTKCSTVVAIFSVIQAHYHSVFLKTFTVLF